MWVIPAYLKTLLFPPASMFLLAAVAWLLGWRWPRLGKALVAFAIFSLYALSTPLVGGALLRSLESEPALTADRYVDDAGAIVVLSAGLARNAPEYGGDIVAGTTLQRLRYGAWLHRATRVPLLVTGGRFEADETPHGVAMAQSLADEFRLSARWVESQALNTLQNAELSAAILRPEGIRKIYLVTTASHMPRAKVSFEAVGLEVVPAPTGFTPPFKFNPTILIPSAGALSQSTSAFYELIGRLWYRLVYY